LPQKYNKQLKERIIMDNTPSSPGANPPVAAPTHVIVTKTGDSLFGKVFRILKEDAEYVIAEIETEIGYITHIFHKNSVEPTPAPQKGDSAPPALPVAVVTSTTAGISPAVPASQEASQGARAPYAD
jgi:hypothetical protein